jgi:hypothetical protein
MLSPSLLPPVDPPAVECFREHAPHIVGVRHPWASVAVPCHPHTSQPQVLPQRPRAVHQNPEQCHAARLLASLHPGKSLPNVLNVLNVPRLSV